MATAFLVLVVLLVLAALVFGVFTLLSGEDQGLGPVEPDGRAVPLPNNRSLTETDLKTVRFDVAARGYRMDQVDRLLRRTAYDLGYKDEMIAVLEAEAQALREGRREDANLLRKARQAAANPSPTLPTTPTRPGRPARSDDFLAPSQPDDDADVGAEADGSAALIDLDLTSDGAGMEPGTGRDEAAFDADPSTYTGPGRLAPRLRDQAGVARSGVAASGEDALDDRGRDEAATANPGDNDGADRDAGDVDLGDADVDSSAATPGQPERVEGPPRA